MPAIASHPSFDAPGSKCPKCGVGLSTVLSATADDIGQEGIACPPNTKLTQWEYETVQKYRDAIWAITSESAGHVRRPEHQENDDEAPVSV